jgi:hypothetical protein
MCWAACGIGDQQGDRAIGELLRECRLAESQQQGQPELSQHIEGAHDWGSHVNASVAVNFEVSLRMNIFK